MGKTPFYTKKTFLVLKSNYIVTIIYIKSIKYAYQSKTTGTIHKSIKVTITYIKSPSNRSFISHPFSTYENTVLLKIGFLVLK